MNNFSSHGKRENFWFSDQGIHIWNVSWLLSIFQHPLCKMSSFLMRFSSYFSIYAIQSPAENITEANTSCSETPVPLVTTDPNKPAPFTTNGEIMSSLLKYCKRVLEKNVPTIDGSIMVPSASIVSRFFVDFTIMFYHQEPLLEGFFEFYKAEASLFYKPYIMNKPVLIIYLSNDFLSKVSEGSIVHVSETTKVLDVASSIISHQTVASVQSASLSSSISIPATSFTSLSSQTQPAVAAPAAQTLPVVPEQPAPEPERPVSPKKKMKRKVCICKICVSIMMS